eukprot:CAMPEP_0115756442 /NCGR_PEP_ID=MMETSP0272-20121206/97927_1 /TAXON_ID=71861 /ORGANISM="Scrippsiella trochoidea, Strain CCMP3099" /LENGTH=450 /DNA_ID=CAMNT_0003201959 /DNA_START=213 /DNA_END=1565 /DNA_ORIENTATION=+
MKEYEEAHCRYCRDLSVFALVLFSSDVDWWQRHQKVFTYWVPRTCGLMVMFGIAIPIGIRLGLFVHPWEFVASLVLMLYMILATGASAYLLERESWSLTIMVNFRISAWVALIALASFVYLRGAIVALSTEIEYIAALEVSAMRLQCPIWLAVTVGAVLLLTPCAALLWVKAPLDVKVEVVASAADFSSDVYVLMSNLFFNVFLFYAQLGVAVGAALVTVLYNFGATIVDREAQRFMKYAFMPFERLRDQGFSQVFDDIDGSLEKCIANTFAVVFLALATAIFPILMLIGGLLAATSLVLLGVFLQGVRLLHLRAVTVRYRKFLGQEHIPSGDEDELQHIDAETYHRSVLIELVFEAAPGIGLNILNYHLLREADLEEQMSWASLASVLISIYMVARIGFKYGFFLLWKGKSLSTMQVVPTGESEHAKTVREAQIDAAWVAISLTNLVIR